MTFGGVGPSWYGAKNSLSIDVGGLLRESPPFAVRVLDENSCPEYFGDSSMGVGRG